MLTDDYTVRLENFEGPLDLLLHLIRRAEMEITDIPISAIADQYMEHLKGIELVDIDVAGEFLVMAATLVEIKSRMLAPQTAKQSLEGEGDAAQAGDAPGARESGVDPRQELIHQLIAYKRSRDAAEALEQMREEWERRFPGRPAAFDAASLAEAMAPMDDVEIEDLGLYDLVEAFGKISQQVDFNKLGAHRVSLEEEDIPIEVHGRDIVERLRSMAAPDAAEQRAQLEFRELFRGKSRVEMIGLFLALLELVRSRVINVRQSESAAEIVLELAEAAPAQA